MAVRTSSRWAPPRKSDRPAFPLDKAFERRQEALSASAVVGIDAGKYTHALVVRAKGRKDSKPLTFENTRPGFEEALQFLDEHAHAPVRDVLVGIEFAGAYGQNLAYFLRDAGYRVVSVLPSHTKRWKEVIHGQPLKTDQKDAHTITDLLAQGRFVSYPFLASIYAELRHLTSARERVMESRRIVMTRLRSVLQVIFPEYEALFPDFAKATPIPFLAAFPGPGAILKAPKRKVLALMRELSRGHVGKGREEQLFTAAKTSIGLGKDRPSLHLEIKLLADQYLFFAKQLKALDEELTRLVTDLPEAQALTSIPNLSPVAAAIFLGSTGDPKAYSSGWEIIRLAGLTLVEASSGTHKGTPRISRRGRPALRAMAYMFTLRNITEEGFLRARYERHYKKNGGKGIKAMVAVMRYALRLMYARARECRPFTTRRPPQVRLAR